MKGKIAFVLGVAVGYVLGSRAGRERYEQIKRGAESIWNTDAVQKGVGVVQGALDDRADEVKTFIRRASSDAFAHFARQTAPKQQTAAQPEAPAQPEASAQPTASPQPAAKSKAASSKSKASSSKPKASSSQPKTAAAAKKRNAKADS